MVERPIRQYMSVQTQWVAPCQSLHEASKIMRENHIRHLAVLDDERVVGILSQTDLHIVESLRAADPDTVEVGAVMTPMPYMVPPEESLDEVARVMAEHRYGCALVVDNGILCGIFTVTDAVRVLAEVLAAQIKR